MIKADPKAPKTYVRPDNTAVLTCTYCGCQKVVLADLFKGHKHILKVKCACQKIFIVNLEFRNRIRKKVQLKGTYINHSQKDNSGLLIIEDISVTGFRLAFSSLDVKKFKVGDELSVEITLDDEHQTAIKKEAIVRNIRQNGLGCTFEESRENFGSPLGYYIMSK